MYGCGGGCDCGAVVGGGGKRERERGWWLWLMIYDREVHVWQRSMAWTGGCGVKCWA